MLAGDSGSWVLLLLCENASGIQCCWYSIDDYRCCQAWSSVLPWDATAQQACCCATNVAVAARPIQTWLLLLLLCADQLVG
ncbi:hypothetical protein U1Q18_015597, partial [Sarracenia purpurea var. burkii]